MIAMVSARNPNRRDKPGSSERGRSPEILKSEREGKRGKGKRCPARAIVSRGRKNHPEKVFFFPALGKVFTFSESYSYLKNRRPC